MSSKVGNQAALLAICLALSLAPLVSQALTEGDYTYTVTNGQSTITNFRTSYTGSLVITNSLGDYPVASIGARAFENCSGLTSVTIPSGVTNLGDWAFNSCYKIVSVKVGSNVTALGNCAFYKCDSLTGVFFEGNAPARCNASVFTSIQSKSTTSRTPRGGAPLSAVARPCAGTPQYEAMRALGSHPTASASKSLVQPIFPSWWKPPPISRPALGRRFSPTPSEYQARSTSATLPRLIYPPVSIASRGRDTPNLVRRPGRLA